MFGSDVDVTIFFEIVQANAEESNRTGAGVRSTEESVRARNDAVSFSGGGSLAMTARDRGEVGVSYFDGDGAGQ